MPDSNFTNLLNSKIMLMLTWLAALTLVAGVGWAGYQRYQDLLEVRADIEQAMQPATSSTQQQSAIIDTRRVQARFLFGRPQKQARPVPVVIDAPITRLRLTLIGVVAADEVEQSKAIVQIDNKQVAIFRIGDAIPKTNAEVYQIEPTRILLSRNGKLERLEIDRPELEEKDRDVQILIQTDGETINRGKLPTVSEVDIKAKHLSTRPPARKPANRKLPMELPSGLPPMNQLPKAGKNSKN